MYDPLAPPEFPPIHSVERSAAGAIPARRLATADSPMALTCPHRTPFEAVVGETGGASGYMKQDVERRASYILCAIVGVTMVHELEYHLLYTYVVVRHETHLELHGVAGLALSALDVGVAGVPLEGRVHL